MPEMFANEIEQSACQKLVARLATLQKHAAPVDARGTVRGRGDREGSAIIVCEARSPSSRKYALFRRRRRGRRHYGALVPSVLNPWPEISNLKVGSLSVS